MTTSNAFVLAALIAAVFVADAYWLHADLPVYLGKRMVELIDFFAFWR